MSIPAQQSSVEPGVMLREFYGRLLEAFGPQKWWPARTRFEVIVGAILTQNTAWHNAALAVKQLRKAGLLHPAGLRQASPAILESLIRPAGFFRQKSRAIRNFLAWLEQAHGGSIASLFAQDPHALRNELLKLKGLGPETVDAILLYAGRRPFFVADAYTRRILSRHSLAPTRAGYAEVQLLLHQHLPQDHRLFNEYHALLVEVGKRYCKRSRALCESCPLGSFLTRERVRAVNDAEQAKARSSNPLNGDSEGKLRSDGKSVRNNTL